MALIYNTTMSPTKLELIAAWLPSQPWFRGDVASLESRGAYRFDDPEGDVGMEGHLLTAGDDTVYHVPLTYRGAPLEGGDAFLLGTGEHGVLGTRWIMDGIGDPVYRSVLATTIALGGREADELGADPGEEPTPRTIMTRLRGSGDAGSSVPDLSSAEVTNEGSITSASDGLATLSLLRRVGGPGLAPGDAQVLRATWPGQDDPSVLAVLQIAGA